MRMWMAIVVLAGFVANVQAAPPSQTPPTSYELTSEQAASETPPLSAPRVAGEVLAGAGLGALGLFGGGIVGLGAAAVSNCSGEFCAFGYIGIGAAVGYVALVPLGVYLVGTGEPETGSLGWTYAGSLAGGLLGVAAMAGTDGAQVAVGLAAIAPIAGATIGFNATRRYERAAPGPRVVPTASVTGERSMFGIAGRF